MTDNFITKDDLTVLVASLKEEFSKTLQERDQQLKNDFDIRENKIHSSYAKKIAKSQGHNEDEESQDTSSRKPSKRELELQDSVDKLLKEMDTAKKETALAKQRNSFVETLSQAGLNPKAIDTIYKLQNADNAFVDNGNGDFHWRVKANGVPVSLPLNEAVKYYLTSEEAQLFLPPKTAGSGSTPPKSTSSTNGKVPSMEVNWNDIGKEMFNK